MISNDNTDIIPAPPSTTTDESKDKDVSEAKNKLEYIFKFVVVMGSEPYLASLKARRGGLNVKLLLHEVENTGRKLVAIYVAKDDEQDFNLQVPQVKRSNDRGLEKRYAQPNSKKTTVRRE